MKQKLETVGERLRRLRVESDVSQADVAGWIGVSEPHISQIENGVRGLSRSLEDAIERAFSTPNLFRDCIRPTLSHALRRALTKDAELLTVVGHALADPEVRDRVLKAGGVR